jgi:hypothetical protein
MGKSVPYGVVSVASTTICRLERGSYTRPSTMFPPTSSCLGRGTSHEARRAEASVDTRGPMDDWWAPGGRDATCHAEVFFEH